MRLETYLDSWRTGGQFLRAYIERYNNPPVNNLITFGSQHMGVSDIPACSPYDFLCQVARRAAKAAIYGSWAQENIIQVCYFESGKIMELMELMLILSRHSITEIQAL